VTDHGYPQGTDSAAFFQILIDGTSVLDLPGTAIDTWTNYTFSFTGTGSDALTIEAQTNPGEWYADDVSVTGAAVGTSAAPLPAALPLFASGLGAMGLLGWRRKRKNAAALAAA